MSTTYLEYRDGSSHKFWEITVKGNGHTVRFGKAGTQGQTKTKIFDSAEAARADAEALVRTKTKKGYASVERGASGSQSSSRGMGELVNALIRAMTKRIDAEEDRETREDMYPRARKPVSVDQIESLERAWRRPLPPTYRAFLETCNGIENAGGTHLLLGTEDQTWASSQVASLSEFWDDEEGGFDVDACIPASVPDSGSGIHNFVAFTRSDAEEMEVVDWDYGRPLARYRTFEAFLEHLLELEGAIERSHADARLPEVSEAPTRAVPPGVAELPRSDHAVGTGEATVDVPPLADRIDYDARLSIPRNAELERQVASGAGLASYGTWLSKQGHAVGELIAADLAADAEPKRERKAKNAAKAAFAAYRKRVLDDAFPALARHLTHFLEGEYYLSFHYGFLEKLDTFPLDTPEERAEALAFLSDPHAMFVQHVTLRKATFDRLDSFTHLHALRRLNFRWTDITQVRSLAPLAELTHLRALDISNSKVDDLRPLAKLPLIQLYCNGVESVDLSPLAGHPTLSDVSFENAKIKDVSPLLRCPKLCKVDLWGTPVPKSQLEELRRHLDDVENEPVDDDALMSGYERGLSHQDA